MFRLLILAVAVGSVWGATVPDGLQPVFDGRIVGGEQCTIDDYPYLISIRYMGSHRCGASLIRENYILTAAHCVSGASTLFLRFVAGSSFRNSGGESLYVSKVIVHEDYVAKTAENDIALVKMDGTFDYSDIIQPISLASLGARFRSGTKATIIGWGTESEGASVIPVQLRYTHVFAVDTDECKAANAEINPVVDGMICAAYPGGGKDSCQGDSGGPLVVGDKQVGIVSWGEGCARPDYPGVYTDVAYYRAWIETNISA